MQSPCGLINQCSKVIALIKVLEKTGHSLILRIPVLHKPFTTHHILTNHVMPLLSMLQNIVQLFCSLEKKHINHLQIYQDQYNGEIILKPNIFILFE